VTITRPRRPRRPIYFHQSAGAVVMIIGRCLVLRRADRDEWVFPKGHLEEGERPEDAAIREVREETGLEIEILGSLGTTRYEFGPRRQHHKRVDWFLGRPVGGGLSLERIFGESALLDADEAQAVMTHAADREVAARAFVLTRELDG
jgi:8-oxo-dGTP pyrophosphatase MutT (NUDIX family)